MTRKKVKPVDGGSPLYVFGLDETGKPRGARFPQGLKDNIVAAAVAMKFNIVHDHSAEFAVLGEKLPIGRIYGSGKSFIPNIRRDLYDKLRAAQERPNEPIKDGVYFSVVGSEITTITHADPAARPLPKTWADVQPGDLVIAQQNHIEGWWEAIIIERAPNDILTLRWRDYPDEGTVQRHLGGIALINPTTE